MTSNLDKVFLKTNVDHTDYVTNLFVTDNPLFDQIVDHPIYKMYVSWYHILKKNIKCNNIEKYISPEMRFSFAYYNMQTEIWKQLLSDEKYNLSDEFVAHVINSKENKSSYEFLDFTINSKYIHGPKVFLLVFEQIILETNEKDLLEKLSANNGHLNSLLDVFIQMNNVEGVKKLFKIYPKIIIFKNILERFILFNFENKLDIIYRIDPNDIEESDVSIVKALTKINDLKFIEKHFKLIPMTDKIQKIILESENIGCILQIAPTISIDHPYVKKFLEKNDKYRFMFSNIIDWNLIQSDDDIDLAKTYFEKLSKNKKELFEIYQKHIHLQSLKAISNLFFEIIIS